jgi:hypothetical protein
MGEFSLPPSRADVIFRSGSGNRRQFPVAVKVDFHFAFAPPGVEIFFRVDDDAEVRSEIPTCAFDARQNFVIFLNRRRIFAPVMSVKIKFYGFFLLSKAGNLHKEFNRIL